MPSKQRSEEAGGGLKRVVTKLLSHDTSNWTPTERSIYNRHFGFARAAGIELEVNLPEVRELVGRLKFPLILQLTPGTSENKIDIISITKTDTTSKSVITPLKKIISRYQHYRDLAIRRNVTDISLLMSMADREFLVSSLGYQAYEHMVNHISTTLRDRNRNSTPIDEILELNINWHTVSSTTRSPLTVKVGLEIRERNSKKTESTKVSSGTVNTEPLRFLLTDKNEILSLFRLSVNQPSPQSSLVSMRFAIAKAMYETIYDPRSWQVRWMRWDTEKDSSVPISFSHTLKAEIVCLYELTKPWQFRKKCQESIRELHKKGIPTIGGLHISVQETNIVNQSTVSYRMMLQKQKELEQKVGKTTVVAVTHENCYNTSTRRLLNENPHNNGVVGPWLPCEAPGPLEPRYSTLYSRNYENDNSRGVSRHNDRDLRFLVDEGFAMLDDERCMGPIRAKGPYVDYKRIECKKGIPFIHWQALMAQILLRILAHRRRHSLLYTHVTAKEGRVEIREVNKPRELYIESVDTSPRAVQTLTMFPRYILVGKDVCSFVESVNLTIKCLDDVLGYTFRLEDIRIYGFTYDRYVALAKKESETIAKESSRIRSYESSFPMDRTPVNYHWE